eukprot:CAMPEP_0195287702 /NCGR_PEP_ID=MMETSP0707-20130614/4658_1 /TAXON_ID=33640 /ORGANISM="Asterionellopsis glacialis, Strain CCMP134" /LENGTH=606 /DNA_ID=CAMNT_0040347483 /DNA_START=110 /DNA_END=1927 /DNA_ORIENTATION=+
MTSNLETLNGGIEVSNSQSEDDPQLENPFASREGRELVWRNVNMTLTTDSSDQETDRKLLNKIWGEVPKHQITAIMGPSGSGKTSLLNILSGRVKTGGKLNVEADVRLDNRFVDPTCIETRKQIAFVAQDDSLQVTATPREAIRFSAKLRLPASTTEEHVHILCEQMISELSLQDCADTIVGGALIKGISGGERKRTSVAVELVTQPALVFLDEPTSGLDSFNADQLCQVLKKVANAGSSVLFTIHQPSSQIFNSFDHLILLNKGRVMYQGSVADVPSFFGNCGYPLPPNFNPADWIMQVALTSAPKELSDAGFFQEDSRPVDDPIVDNIAGKDVLGITLHGNSDTSHVGFITQTKLLYDREVKNFFRAKQAIIARTMMSTLISSLLGCIFLNVAETDFSIFINVQSTFGALLMALLANVFSTALPSLIAFPEERPVFLREYSTNHYSVTAYFASRLTMEFFVTAAQVTLSTLITYFCIGFQGNYVIYWLNIYLLAMTSTALGVLVGSAVSNPGVAVEFLPAVFMPQILFAGFFVPPDLIPDWLAWVRYICPLTYAVRIALVNEFDGRCDDIDTDGQQGRPPVGAGQSNFCDAVLNNAEADPDEVW